MPVIAAYLYRHGCRVREITLNERVDCPNDRSEFVWIGLTDPCAEEVETLRKLYGLHPLAIEDALKDGQLPKVDVYGGQLFVIGRTAHLTEGQIVYGQTAVFLGHSHIITVRQGSTRSHRPLREHLEGSPDLLGQGADYVLHAVLDFIVDGYLPLVTAIEEEVTAMEQRTIDTFLGRAEIARIFALRRELLRFDRILVPMDEVARKLARNDLPCIDAEARHYFSDVLDHVRRVEAMASALREVLTSVFEFSNLMEQQTNRRHHPPACRVGRDPSGADGDRRHLWHELRSHARTAHAIRLSGNHRRDHDHLLSALLAVQASALAVARAMRRTEPRTMAALCDPPESISKRYFPGARSGW